MTLDFVDETPSLTESYAKSSPTEPEISESHSSPWRAGPTESVSPIPDDALALYSGSESTTCVPESESVFEQVRPSNPRQTFNNPSEELETQSNPEYSLIIHGQGDHRPHVSRYEGNTQGHQMLWLPQNLDFPDRSPPGSLQPPVESLRLPAQPSGSRNSDSDYWPDMNAQEAYLMRYYIDKLACWVGFVSHPTRKQVQLSDTIVSLTYVIQNGTSR